MIQLTAPQMPSRLKRTVVIAGLLLTLPGLPLAFSFFCITLVLMIQDNSEAIWVGLISFILMIITIGAGGSAFWHSLQSLRGRNSRSLHLPPLWLLTGIFGLFIVMGLFISENDFAIGLLFPPLLLAAAALPPLMAVSWFRGYRANDGLTWRRGLVAFAGGATISVGIAIILETVFPIIILALVFDLANIVTQNLSQLLEALAGRDVTSAITNPGFIYVFIQIALIAPLVEEFAKPLVTLPLIGRLSQRDAFLVGAMAGAGFATLENMLYAGFGFYFWAGILIVRALGGAIHPLGSGLMALSWRNILRGKPQARTHWFVRFGLAVGIHALWNGGSLLVITLAGARFFGELPAEINVLGLSAAGTTLALLIILGLVALWIGRSFTGKLKSPVSLESESTNIEFTLSDKMIAIWALACLATIIPIGITTLQILIR